MSRLARPLRRPGLLPRELYGSLGRGDRARMDAAVREGLPGLPTAPGRYLDSEGDPWELAADGRWTDKHGATRPVGHNPLLALFGPWEPASRPQGDEEPSS